MSLGGRLLESPLAVGALNIVWVRGGGLVGREGGSCTRVCVCMCVCVCVCVCVIILVVLAYLIKKTHLPVSHRKTRVP